MFFFIFFSKSWPIALKRFNEEIMSRSLKEIYDIIGDRVPLYSSHCVKYLDMNTSARKIKSWLHYQFGDEWLDHLKLLENHVNDIKRSRKINTIQCVGAKNSGKTSIFQSLATFCILFANPRNFSDKFGKAKLVSCRLAFMDEPKDLMADEQELKIITSGGLSEVAIKFKDDRTVKYPPLLASNSEHFYILKLH